MPPEPLLELQDRINAVHSNFAAALNNLGSSLTSFTSQIERDLPMTIRGCTKPTVEHKTQWGSVTIGDNYHYPTLPTGKQNASTEVCITDVPKFARDLFERVNPTATYAKGVTQPETVTQDGKESLLVDSGSASLRAIVYKPTTDAQAQRNLNFAIANLFAAVEWFETGKAKAEEVAKAEAEAKAKAEAEAKAAAEADRKAKEEALKALREQADLEAEALRLYNATHHTSHPNWSTSRIAQYSWDRTAIKREWVEIARKAREAKARGARVIPFYVDPSPFLGNGGRVPAVTVDRVSATRPSPFRGFF